MGNCCKTVKKKRKKEPGEQEDDALGTDAVEVAGEVKRPEMPPRPPSPANSPQRPTPNSPTSPGEALPYPQSFRLPPPCGDQPGPPAGAKDSPAYPPSPTRKETAYPPSPTRDTVDDGDRRPAGPSKAAVAETGQDRLGEEPPKKKGPPKHSIKPFNFGAIAVPSPSQENLSGDKEGGGKKAAAAPNEHPLKGGAPEIPPDPGNVVAPSGPADAEPNQRL